MISDVESDQLSLEFSRHFLRRTFHTTSVALVFGMVVLKYGGLTVRIRYDNEQVAVCLGRGSNKAVTCHRE